MSKYFGVVLTQNTVLLTGRSAINPLGRQLQAAELPKFDLQLRDRSICCYRKCSEGRVRYRLGPSNVRFTCLCECLQKRPGQDKLVKESDRGLVQANMHIYA